jgi:hypothetical protein
MESQWILWQVIKCYENHWVHKKSMVATESHGCYENHRLLWKSMAPMESLVVMDSQWLLRKVTDWNGK